MRNLKRVLSLAMASVMLLGMMVIGAGAANKTAADLTDNAKITNKEAVTLLVDLGLVEGKPDGSFAPAEIVTRATMAKLITVMMMGDVDQTAFKGTVTDLKDINGHWAEGYIKYCYSNGIIVGDGAGHFMPDQPVSVVSAAKMLLVAIGYDAKDRGYENNAAWSINIMKDAQVTTEVISNSTSVRSLTKGLTLKATDPLSRDNAAQMIFNGLFVQNVAPEYAFDMGVRYISKYNSRPSLAAGTFNGLTRVTGALNAVDTVNGTADIGTAGSIKISALTSNIGSTVAYYTNNGTPALVSSIAVLTVDDALATVTDGTEFMKQVTRGQTGYIGREMDAVVNVYINGSFTHANAGAVGTTSVPATASALASHVGAGFNRIGNKFEYIDTNNNGKYDVVKITTYTVSTITKTAAAKADGTEATISIRGISTAIKQSEVYGDFASLKTDDVIIYSKVGTMYYVYEPETVEGKMTQYNSSKNTMTVNGTVYTAAAHNNASGMTSAQSFTGNGESSFYLDEFGYVAVVDGISAAAKYAVVGAIQYISGNVSNPTGYAEANLILTDGTKTTVKVAKLGDNDVTEGSAGNYAAAEVSATIGDNSALANAMYSYTVDSNNNYTLKLVQAGSTQTVTKGVTSVGSLATANNDTVYIYNVIDGTKSTVTVYTGYKNAPTATGATVAVATKGGYATYVYVTAAKAAVGDTSSDTIVFLENAGVDNSGNDPVYLYKASVNGVVDIYKSKSVISFGGSSTNAMNVPYNVALDNDNFITTTGNFVLADDFTSLVASADAKAGALKTIGTLSYAAPINNITNPTLSFTGSETVYVIGGKDVVEGSASDIKAGTFFWVKTVDKTTVAGTVAMKTVYVLAPSDSTESAFATAATLTDGTTPVNLLSTPLAITGAAAGDTFHVAVTAPTGSFVEASIKGAGTTVSASVQGTSLTTGNYTLVTGDIGNQLTVTVTVSQPGKGVVTNTYYVSVAA